MAYKNNPGIYLITCKTTGKVYVGSSNAIQRRWYEHTSTLNRNIHGNEYLQHAWNKYGQEDFVFEVLENCPIEELMERENFWINFYDSMNRDKGYNISDAERKAVSKETRLKLSRARRGKKMSDETKRKLSEINKGRTFTLSEEAKLKISEGNKGKPKSKEHREALSKAHSGRKWSQSQHKAHIGKHKKKLTYEQAQEIRKLKAEGVHYKELMKMFNVSDRTIYDVVNNKYHKEKGE